MSVKTYLEENQEKLDLYTTAITRAHGKNHPEAFEVRDIYTRLEDKVLNNDQANLNLDQEFAELRQITNNYEVPSDVCQTYEATYQMLAEADKKYTA